MCTSCLELIKAQFFSHDQVPDVLFSISSVIYHFCWHWGLKILLFPTSQITCRWCFLCVCVCVCVRACAGWFYFHFLLLIKPAEQNLVFMMEVLTSFFLWSYICFVANLVGDEKPCEIRELGIFFFLYVCLVTLVSLEQGMPALCVGAERSTMLVSLPLVP